MQTVSPNHVLKEHQGLNLKGTGIKVISLLVEGRQSGKAKCG